MPSFAPLSDRDLQLFRAAFAEQEEVFEVMGWELENAMRSVEEGDPDIALMLLLCLLPRLSCIDVLDNAISPDLVDFVVLAAGAVTGMLEMKCPAALANLSSAFLQHGATVTDIRLSFLMQWAALPAMRTIGCRALSQETTPSDFMLAVGSGHLLEASPRLAFTDLRLEYSCIGSSALIWMLERSKGLKGFYYEYGGSTVGFAEFVPSEFRDALLRYCKGTLERLTLATAYDDGYGYGEHKRFAGSLQDFEVLEMVDMPLEMLVDSDDNELDSDCNSIVSDTPRLEKLVDTLPASLQILRIPGPLRDTDELVDQLMSLLERKEESQPKLTKIAIGSVDDIEAFRRGPLEEACKAVGVILEEWKLEAAHQWLDDPAW